MTARDNLKRLAEMKTGTPEVTVDRRLLRALIAEFEQREQEQEEYAAEGWKWLDDALAALSVKDVFGIKGAKDKREQRERKVERLIAAGNDVSAVLRPNDIAAPRVVKAWDEAVADLRPSDVSNLQAEEPPEPTFDAEGNPLDAQGRSALDLAAEGNERQAEEGA